MCCRLHCYCHLNLKLHWDAFGHRTGPVGVCIITEEAKVILNEYYRETLIMGFLNVEIKSLSCVSVCSLCWQPCSSNSQGNAIVPVFMSLDAERSVKGCLQGEQTDWVMISTLKKLKGFGFRGGGHHFRSVRRTHGWSAVKHRLVDAARGSVQDAHEIVAYVDRRSRLLLEEKQTQMETGKELELFLNFSSYFANRQTDSQTRLVRPLVVVV